MAFLTLTISENKPVMQGRSIGAVYDLSPNDLRLSFEDFVQRITLPMTAQVLDRSEKVAELVQPADVS